MVAVPPTSFPVAELRGGPVFNIGGNKYGVIAGVAFSVQMLWVKAVLTHAQYDEGDWK